MTLMAATYSLACNPDDMLLTAENEQDELVPR